MNSRQPNNNIVSLFGFDKTRGKFRLALLVLIHIAVWCIIFLLPFLSYQLKVEGRNFFLREVLSKLALISLFYLNYYYLLPKFFEKRKYAAYFSFVLLFIALVIAWDISLARSFPHSSGRFTGISLHPLHSFADSEKAGSFFMPYKDSFAFRRFPFNERWIFGIPEAFFFGIINRVVSFALVLLLIGGMVRLWISFINNQQEKKALENAKLNAEISLLKSQIQPHFLFNTLNSIYSLAHQKSDKTESTILKLSELLRYMLYESAEEKVALSKEITYLTNYIQLQRMRLSSKVKIEYEVAGNTDGCRIAPMLLITFIENTFKHGVSYLKPGAINIWIRVFEKTLTLHTANPHIESNSFTEGGLGLKNVTRRLDLLYQGKYELAIAKDESQYIVDLKLDLND